MTRGGPEGNPKNLENFGSPPEIQEIVSQPSKTSQKISRPPRSIYWQNNFRGPLKVKCLGKYFVSPYIYILPFSFLESGNTQMNSIYRQYGGHHDGHPFLKTKSRNISGLSRTIFHIFKIILIHNTFSISSNSVSSLSKKN